MDDSFVVIVILGIVTFVIYISFRAIRALLLKVLKIDQIIAEIKISQEQLRTIHKNQYQMEQIINNIEKKLNK